MSRFDSGTLVGGKRWVVAAVTIGAIIGLILSAFGGEFQRRLVFDTWQQWVPREASDENVVVVMIDDASVAAKGQWPWRRTDMAALLQNITLAEPVAIGIDIYFVEPDPLRPEMFVDLYNDEALDEPTREQLLTLPYGDQLLTSVIETAPVVMPWVTTDTGGRDLSELIYAQVEGTPPPETLRAERMLTSIPLLDDAAAARGVVTGPPDPDGITRRLPLSVVAGDQIVPGFAVQLANLASGDDVLRWTDAGLQVGAQQVASDNRGNFEFKMGPGWEAKAIPAIEILQGDFNVEELQGKVVILGFGATGTTDIAATPVASEMQGTLIQAQAVDAILSGEWLSRPDWIAWLEFALAASLILLLLATAFTSKNWFLAPAAALAASLPPASFLAYDSANLLLDPARPIIIGLFAALALLLVRYALTLIELVEKRVFAAEQKKENENAREIQMSMVPSENVLARLDDRTEIAAILEPAKSVGGDFFDAVKIDDNKLLFLIGDVSGKGMPAALFMALSKTMSKSNLARAHDGLAAAVASLNNELMEEADPQMGLTMLIGVLDCASGSVELVNAGHENPLLIRSDGRVEMLDMVGGPPFCVIPFAYPVERFQIGEGEMLVLITDGATEAANAQDKLFGVSGVVAALGKSDTTNAKSRTKSLASEVRQFEGETDPSDDLTIFAVRYLGSAASPSG